MNTVSVPIFSVSLGGFIPHLRALTTLQRPVGASELLFIARVNSVCICACKNVYSHGRYLQHRVYGLGFRTL